MLWNRQLRDKITTAPSARNALLALSMGIIAVCVGWLNRLAFFDTLAIGLIVLIGVGVLVYLSGVPSFFYGLAAVAWVSYGPNLFFLSSLLSGATIIELAVYLGLLILVTRAFVAGRPVVRELSSTPLLLPLLGFVLATFVAFFVGPDLKSQYNFAMQRQASFYALAIYLLFANSIHRPQQAIRVLMALTFGGVLFGALVSFTIGGVFDPLARVQQTRAADYEYLGRGWETGYVQVATYLSLVIPIATSLMLYSRRVWLNLLFGAAVVSLGLMLFLSEGRGGMIAGVAGVAVVVLLSSAMQRPSLWKATVVAALMAAVFNAVIGSGLLSNSVFNRLGLLRDMSSDPSVYTRLAHWQMDWKILINYPLGVGFDYTFTINGMSAHNELLQVALGSGFLGVFCYGVFFVGILRRLVRGLKHVDRDARTVCIAVLGCCVAYMINGITDNPSANNLWGWQVLWIVLATGGGVLHTDKPGSILE